MKPLLDIPFKNAWRDIQQQHCLWSTIHVTHYLRKATMCDDVQRSSAGRSILNVPCLFYQRWHKTGFLSTNVLYVVPNIYNAYLLKDSYLLFYQGIAFPWMTENCRVRLTNVFRTYSESKVGWNRMSLLERSGDALSQWPYEIVLLSSGIQTNTPDLGRSHFNWKSYGSRRWLLRRR